MTIVFAPVGTCPETISITLENGVITALEAVGGCSGNLQGLGRLLEGMSAQEAVRRLEGIRCDDMQTSCPDQIARELKRALAQAAFGQ